MKTKLLILMCLLFSGEVNAFERIDTTPPTFASLMPASGQTVTDEDHLTFEATDNVVIAKIVAVVNGSYDITIFIGRSKTVFFDKPFSMFELKEGFNSVVFYAYDQAGNKRTIERYYFY